MKLIPLILLIFTTACLNKIPVVAHYQQKATEKCEAKHAPEECRPLPYPSEVKD